MNINHRHYILAFFALLALCFSTFAYTVMYKLIISQAEKSSIALAQAAVENQQKLNQTQVTDAYADTSTDRAEAATFLITQDHIVDFIEALEKIGTASNTDFEMSTIDTEQSVSKTKTEAGYITSHLTITGSWNNVMRALIILENMPYSLQASNVIMNVSADSSAPASQKGQSKASAKLPQWEASLDIKVLTAN